MDDLLFGSCMYDGVEHRRSNNRVERGECMDISSKLTDICDDGVTKTLQSRSKIIMPSKTIHWGDDNLMRNNHVGPLVKRC